MYDTAWKRRGFREYGEINAAALIRARKHAEMMLIAFEHQISHQI